MWLDVLEASMRFVPTNTTLVRMADRRLGSRGEIRGAIREALRLLVRVAELVSDLEDPFVRCSFRSLLRAHVWCLTAAYDEAYEQALLHAPRRNGVSCRSRTSVGTLEPSPRHRLE